MAQFPRGLFDVGIATLNATTEVVGTLIHNFNPRSVSATYQADTAELQGADTRLEDLAFNERYELSLETAGIPQAALAALEGVTLTTTGSAGTLITFFKKNVTSNQRPYVRFRAQQKDKSGGATVFTWYKTSLNGSPTWNMAQGEYDTPTLPLIAIPAGVAIASPDPIVAVGDLYGVDVYATYGALS